MKDLKITITRDGGYYRMNISCEYSKEAEKKVMSYFGCCHYDGKVLTTGLLTANPVTLIEAQSFLLAASK
mgnify:CR=1 FL=1